MPTSDPADFEPGAVVVVPFPYSDRLAEKRRPALVVSGETVAKAGFVWIVMITSARNSALPGDLPIADLGASGLTVPSVVRPVKIACIEPSRIQRRIGALPTQAAEAVLDTIRASLGPV